MCASLVSPVYARACVHIYTYIYVYIHYTLLLLYKFRSILVYRTDNIKIDRTYGLTDNNIFVKGIREVVLRVSQKNLLFRAVHQSTRDLSVNDLFTCSITRFTFPCSSVSPINALSTRGIMFIIDSGLLNSDDKTDLRRDIKISEFHCEISHTCLILLCRLHR